MIIAWLSFILTFPLQAVAAPEVCMVTGLFGEAQVLTKFSGQGEAMIYEGTKYNFRKLKVGERLAAGEIVKCLSPCKAKLVFSNGDAVFVGPGSMVMVNGGGQANLKQPAWLNIFYGKIRAMIDPAGPRKNQIVKTPATAAGVRGTDFSVVHYDETGTHTATFQGLVEVESANGPVQVSAGQVAQVQMDAKTVPARPLVQKEVQDIANFSNVEAEPSEPEIVELEKKALENAKTHLKKVQPQINLEKIKESEKSSSTALMALTASSVFRKAPSGKPKWKTDEPQLKEIPFENDYKKFIGR